MRVIDICTRSVVTCGRDTSALEIATLMREQHVGDVVIVDEREGKSTPVGIVTDRDLVVQVMARGLGPDSLRAGDLIVGELETTFESEFVHEAIWHMRGKRVRRLPVVDAQGRLTGMLTADDVSRFLAQALTEIAALAPCQAQHEHTRRP